MSRRRSMRRKRNRDEEMARRNDANRNHSSIGQRSLRWVFLLGCGVLAIVFLLGFAMLTTVGWAV